MRGRCLVFVRQSALVGGVFASATLGSEDGTPIQRCARVVYAQQHQGVESRESRASPIVSPTRSGVNCQTKLAIAMVSRPSRTALRPGETMASARAEAHSNREDEFAGAHLARRPRASGTTYHGTADYQAHVGAGEANNLAPLTISEARLGQRLSPWPLEAILADAAIAEALLAMEAPLDDAPVGQAIGVPVYIASTVTRPVMGIPVDPTNQSSYATSTSSNPWRGATQRAYYDAYYNAYYSQRTLQLDQLAPPAPPVQTHNSSNNRPANNQANDSFAMENMATRFNTVGITYLRSDVVGITDPEVSATGSPNGQRAFRSMLRGSSRGQDNRRPRICITNDWRRHCPWAARLRRVERLTEETERLVESVERLSRGEVAND